MPTTTPPARIAFQGLPGAYSDLACRHAFPNLETLACPGFEDAFDAVLRGKVRLAMIPIENSVAGRVAEIHHLMSSLVLKDINAPTGAWRAAPRLHIVAEHFQRVNHHLLAPPGASLKTVKTVQSHVQGLDQCRAIVRKLKLKRVVGADTAGSAAEVAKAGDITRAAIASELAGSIYGLVSLRKNIEDAEHNTTRFIVLSREVAPIERRRRMLTTFIFRVRNVPASLYKALGGFATNGVNMTKLESYMIGGRFEAAQFYADVEGHPDDPGPRHALDELRFFSRDVCILGTYPAHAARSTGKADESD